VTKVIALIRRHYRDFGPTLATEYLAEQHAITLSKETVRQIMSQAKLWRPQRGRRARLHALRERRPCFGELIQIDGSQHAWFEARGPRCCLLVFIDDATSRLTALRFVAQECTLGYMQTLYDHIRQHGLPMSLYSDRHGIFRVNTGPACDDVRSQFGRALHSLGIESICANSPQAKGRVERANGVLQDRLVKALRLAGIDSIAAANAWLPGFIARHNDRFAVPPLDPRDAHAPDTATADRTLRQILAKHYPRTLSKTLTCQFHCTLLQVQPGSRRALRGASVNVVEHFDGQFEVLCHGETLPHTAVQHTRIAPLEQGRKEITASRRSSAHPPKRNHPWRTTRIGPLSPEFVVRN
jgi:hypothetical protein